LALHASDWVPFHFFNVCFPVADNEPFSDSPVSCVSICEGYNEVCSLLSVDLPSGSFPQCILAIPPVSMWFASHISSMYPWLSAISATLKAIRLNVLGLNIALPPMALHKVFQLSPFLSQVAPLSVSILRCLCASGSSPTGSFCLGVPFHYTFC
jgi:hypothetical protein